MAMHDTQQLPLKALLDPRAGQKGLYIEYEKEFWNTQWTWFWGLKTGLAVCLQTI